jgi:4-hydroxyproline epimerase
MQQIRVIDSHTGGEPTRLVITGGPELTGSMPERRAQMMDRHDAFRAAIMNEPRGHDVLVGGMLTPPLDPRHATGVVYFNNVGVLHMCGHATIGLVVTLAHLGRIQPGEHVIETSVGLVKVLLEGRDRVTFDNVVSYRYRKAVAVEVPGYGTVTGDIAWGGNWFFLIGGHGQDISLDRVAELTAYTMAVRSALVASGITGHDGGEIDHIELFGPSATASGQNFVLCPGSAYDRSPCGTGTSAKLACLAADGKLAPAETWLQESVVGSVFEGSYRVVDDEIPEDADGIAVVPRVTGTAFVTADANLLLDPEDPFCWGIGR